MTDAQRLAVERVLHERHLANMDALDDDPRHPAYQWGTRAALAERARAYNALAAYHRNPNPRNRAALILALAWGLDGKFTTGAQARAASWLDDLEEPQP
jgi:hypothetical protein